MNKIIFLITICVALAFSCWGRETEASDVNHGNIVIKQTLPDGVTIAVHYRPDNLKPYHKDISRYASTILLYAVEAYNEIIYMQGFDTPGFTFANPDKEYCYDIDRTIDIYIAKGGKNEKGLSSFSGADFLEAPCYDIIKSEGTAYNAVILFPADYSDYLARWHNRDFSEQEIDKKLRASLYHEIFHIISYSYNKNIEPWYSNNAGTSAYQGGDWYVEGLARYFETIAGSYDNFFSEGFIIRKDNDKVSLFQGGANYLMAHPQESLKEARYDYSLFWAYLHKRYGMDKIEEASRRLRFISEGGIREELPLIISLVLKEDFEDVLGGFAIAMYFKHFNPDIKRGLKELKVMSLEDFSGSGKKRLSSWATNFITLDLIGKPTPANIAIKKTGKNGELRIRIFARLQDGKIVYLPRVAIDRSDILCKMDLAGMKQSGVKELMLIITNIDAERNLQYRVLQS